MFENCVAEIARVVAFFFSWYPDEISYNNKEKLLPDFFLPLIWEKL